MNDKHADLMVNMIAWGRGSFLACRVLIVLLPESQASETVDLRTQTDTDMADKLAVPDGLTELLHDFAVAVLVEQPTRIHEFAADYFVKLRDSKRSVKPVPMYIIVDDDEESGEPADLRSLTHRNQPKSSRRKSVSAERYNPEEEEEDEGSQIRPADQIAGEEKRRLMDSLKNMLLFRSMDDEQLARVMNAMTKKSIQPGNVIIKQGDDGDYFYVIDRGTFDVYVWNEERQEALHVHTFENSGSFGELALMYSQPRTATITARTDGCLWAMDRKSFQRIVTRESFKNRRMYQQLLCKVPFLKPLSEEERSSVVDGLCSKVYYDGDCIIQAGDEGDGIYFIETGMCSVCLDKGEGEKEVNQLTNGNYFGELALLDNSKRTASVYAKGRVKCGFLAREAFERLLGPCRDIMERAKGLYEMV